MRCCRRLTAASWCRRTLGPTGRGAEESRHETREKLRRLLRLGELEEREVELELADDSGGPSLSIMTPQGVEEMGVQFKDLLSGMMPKQTRSADEDR